jgi:uridine kinase
VKKPKQPLLVAIVGGSGSGKSWLADKLQAALTPNAGRLSLDDFYRDHSHLSPAQRERINFDKPAAIDWPAFERVLNSCLRLKKTRIPRYDFSTHCRLPRSKILNPRPIMLIDGLWLLRAAQIRKLFTVRIFIDAPMRLRLRRRLARDVTGRGRSAKSVRDQFRKTVEPMHRRFVLPQIQWAGVVLEGDWGNHEVTKLTAVMRQKMEKDPSRP